MNLSAALDITEAAQKILISSSDPLIEPLIDTNEKLLIRDSFLLNVEKLSLDWWEDIASAVSDVSVECAMPDFGGAFP